MKIEERGNECDDVIVHLDTLEGRNVYECQAVFIREDEGGYSARVANLPGVVTEGDTIDEAICNLKDAFAGAIVTYMELGREIPWSQNPSGDWPSDCVRRWILIDA